MVKGDAYFALKRIKNFIREIILDHGVTLRLYYG
jgi:hypothetical protein